MAEQSVLDSQVTSPSRNLRKRERRCGVADESLGNKRVNPEIAQVFLLDEIADRLLRLEKTLPVRPEGIVEPLTPTRATIEAKVIHPPYKKKWFSVSVVNDGPEDCWIVVNTEKSPAQPYLTRVGEEYSVDMGNAVIEDIRVYTETGSANLRIKGVR